MKDIEIISNVPITRSKVVNKKKKIIGMLNCFYFVLIINNL